MIARGPPRGSRTPTIQGAPPFEPDDEQIAARLHHEVLEAVAAQHLGAAVDGVTLGDAAEAEAHAGAAQLHGVLLRVDDDVAIVDELAAALDLGGGRDLLLEILVELPQAAHRRVGDVERAVGPARHVQAGLDDLHASRRRPATAVLPGRGD